MEVVNNNKNKEKDSKQVGQEDSSKQSSEDRNTQESGESSDKSEEGDDSSNSQKEGESSSGTSNKIYSMQANNMLGKQNEIDWDELKNKIENLYTTWPVVSLDLEKMGVSSEELNNFSKNMDRVAIAIKNENKEETISSVVDLYGFLPAFINVYEGNSKEKNVIETKFKLLNCYKYADLENWDELDRSVEELKMSFSNIVNKKEEFSGKEVNIRSGEVFILMVMEVAVQEFVHYFMQDWRLSTLMAERNP